MKLCVQCHREVKIIKTEVVGGINDVPEMFYLGVCERPRCPNYHLAQVPEEVEEKEVK